jgi:tetratricopeptide (TPR) repeat protein
MHVLGFALEKQGRLDEAERVLEEAADRFSRIFDEDNIYRISTREDLARVYLSQGRYAEAEAGLRESYEAYRRVLGEQHQRTLVALHRVALVLHRSGRSTEAEAPESRALEDHRRIAGADHPDTVEMVETMAGIYNAMRDYDRARVYVGKLIELRAGQAADAGASSSVKVAYAKLLLTCEPADLRDPQTALRVALDAAERSDSPGAEVLHTVALAYHSTGDLRRAVDYQQRAIEAMPDGRSEERATMEAELERYLSQLSGDGS